MKKHIATRTISKIILAGLIVSSLPMNLTAKTRRARRPQTLKKTSLSIASWKTQRPSKEAIDRAVKDIAKLTKRLKKIGIIIQIVLAGAGSLGIATGVGVSILALVLSSLCPPVLAITAVTSTVGAAATIGGVIPVVGATITFTSVATGATVVGQALPLVLTGIIIAIISGTLAMSLMGPITGGLTAAQIITTIALTKKLKNIEKKYPGILTRKQIEKIEKLYQVIKGPITKGIVKGIRLKNALKESVNMALQKHTFLSKKTIQTYIKRSRSARNLQLNINAYKEKIKRQQKARNKHSKWKLAWHKKNLKVIALKANPKYTILKVRLKWFKNKLKGILIKRALAPAVSDYIQKADKITADLAKKLVKAATTKKGN